MKDVVTISRQWHEPTIRTWVSNEGIYIAMPLEDFMKAVEREIGSVTTTFTEKAFHNQLDSAVKRVLYGMKRESVRVV